MKDEAYEICAPYVVGEVIDGEAIIMDLRSSLFKTDHSQTQAYS